MNEAIENVKIRYAIENVLDIMRADFIQWQNNCPAGNAKIREEMADEYCEGLSVKEGRKYFRIAGTNRNGCETVKGFIVKSGDKKFQEGDMLKPAGFNAPARNFARGNVFDEASTGTVDWPQIRWTGIG
tara:strand:+ start:282 stop:668 length:387 start_codon:yes stop_codon:yes gene_type:complete